MSAPRPVPLYSPWEKAGYIALGLALIPVMVWMRHVAPTLSAGINTGLLLLTVFAGRLWRRRSAGMSFASGPAQARRRGLVLALGLVDIAGILSLGLLWPVIGSAAFLPAILAAILASLILRALGPRYRSWLQARTEDLDDYHRVERHRARDYAMTTIAASAVAMTIIWIGLASVVHFMPSPYQIAQVSLGLLAAWAHLPIAILAWRDPDADDEET